MGLGNYKVAALPKNKIDIKYFFAEKIIRNFDINNLPCLTCFHPFISTYSKWCAYILANIFFIVQLIKISKVRKGTFFLITLLTLLYIERRYFKFKQSSSL